MDEHLHACLSGDIGAVKAALRAFRAEFLQGGPPPAAFVDALRACVDGLSPGRGDPTLALEIFLFDALMFIPAGLRRADGPAGAFVAVIQSAAPKLLLLRRDADALVAAWAWHLLSWLPAPVPNVASEALEELRQASRGFMQLTLALTAASTPTGREATTRLLEEWLGGGGERAHVAAMVLTQLHGVPTKPETVSDAAYQRLLELSAVERWDEWEAAPAREFGFFADLSLCFQRAGYARAATTLPALLRIVDRCSPKEIEHVLAVFVKVLFHSHPWPQEARLELLDAAQRDALTELVSRSRVWTPRPGFYGLLKEYGLPLGSRPLALLLGVDAPPDAVTVKSVENGVLTLDTEKTPHQLVKEILEG